MGLILTGLTTISRDQVKTNERREVLDVYRDPKGHVVRFHVLITSTCRQADVQVLVNNRWSRLHHLLTIHTVEDAIARLFTVAADVLGWPLPASKNLMGSGRASSPVEGPKDPPEVCP